MYLKTRRYTMTEHGITSYLYRSQDGKRQLAKNQSDNRLGTLSSPLWILKMRWSPL
jgi:hypothetical protein